MQDESVNQPFIINPMTSKAKHYNDEIFLHMIDAVEKLKRTPLSVFVCGPSNGETPLLQKKIDIINDLRANDITAIVGEEQVSRLKLADENAGRTIQPDNIYELAIAQTVDLIVIIRASPGSIAEAHEFLNHHDISPKTCVCVDTAHADSYSDAGAISLHRSISKVIDYANPQDIESCHLKSAVVKWVHDHQLAKGMQQRGYN
jgi:hypothetical protein